jgi:hypothetical protein
MTAPDDRSQSAIVVIAVVPAGQRPEPVDLPCLQIDQRLVEQLQLLAVERAAKLGLDRKAPPGQARFFRLV